LYTPPIENISLVKICTDTYDWHSAYNELARGWKEIHKDILDAPFCEERQRIVNVWTFRNLYDIDAELTGVCSICFENGVIFIISNYHTTKNLFVFGKRMIKYFFVRSVSRTKKNETKTKTEHMFSNSLRLLPYLYRSALVRYKC